MKKNRKFAVSRNSGIIIMLWAALICCFALIIFISKDKGGTALLLVCISCAAAAALAYFLLRAFYVFEKECLVSVFGPYKTRYYYKKITKIKLAPPQKGILTGVRIAFYSNEYCLGYVCPRDVRGFLAKIKKYISHAETEI